MTLASSLARLSSELGELGGFLWRGLHQEPSRFEVLRDPKPVTTPQEAWRDGYERGEQARIRLADDQRPIISMSALIESMGIHIAEVSLESTSREAVSIHRPGTLPIILLNINAKRVRSRLARRAVLGHELCHLLHDGGERQLSTNEGVVTPLQEGLEQRANGFAPAFLSPPSWLRREFSAIYEDLDSARTVIEQIASRWGFTGQGALWHAQNAGLIPKSFAHSLANDYLDEVNACTPRNHEFELEPTPRESGPLEDADVNSLSAGLVERLAIDAYRGGLISSNRAREILSWS